MNLYDIVIPMTMEEAKATSQRLNPKCWKGKHKEGTKVKGGVRVNNCVPNESVEEGIVGGTQHVPAEAEIKKIIWDTLRINEPTAKESVEAAITMLSKRPKTRMVQQLMGHLKALSDRAHLPLDPFVRSVLNHYNESVAEDSWHGEGDAWGGQDPWTSGEHEMVEGRLTVGDPVIVTASNEFEGKTGEIAEFSPSGKFVIVNLYNHGEHSMHLSDVEYNQHADEEDEMDEGYAADIGLNPKALDPASKWKFSVRQLIADYIKNPQGLYNLAKQKGANSAEYSAYNYIMNPTGKIPLPPNQQGVTENSDSSPVTGAITRRILSQRLDLLKQYGPELVGAAVDNVADYVGDVEEIGSSDVSGWVAQVERMLKENPPEAFGESELDEIAKSDFRNRVEQQQQDVIERIKNSDHSDVVKQYLIAINDPAGPVFKASYRSFPKGQEAKEQLRNAFAQKYNVNPAELEKAEQIEMARALHDKGVHNMEEGFQDFNRVEPYAVCLAGKPVKKFDRYEEARRFHDNWKQKLYRAGNKAKADTITLMPLNLDEEQKPAGWGEFPPKQEITIVPPKKLKSGETYQDHNKYWQSQGQAPIYKTNEEGSPAQQAAIAIAKKKEQGVAEGHADQQRKIFKKNGEPVGEVGIDRESSPGNGQWYMKCYAYDIDNSGYDSYEEAVAELKHCMKQGVAEAETDYSKRCARERDVDAGRPVKALPKNPQTDYAKKLAQDKKDLALGEAAGYESNKAYAEVGTHKRYTIYVGKKKFNDATGFIAAAVNPRTKTGPKANAPTQQEAVEKLKGIIDKEIDIATKVSGAATIDFNVDFVRDILEMSSNTFYAKLVPGPKLVIAGKEMEQYPDIMKSEGFKASSIRTVSDSEGATKLPAMPLSASGAVTAQLIANGRYALGAETIDKDGNRVFELEFDSVVADSRERIRMGAPAITIGTKREVKESYWTRLQAERNTKAARLVAELEESIKDIK